MVCGGISMEGDTDHYRLGNGSLTGIKSLDRLSRCVGSLVTVDAQHAWPHVARVSRQFLEDDQKNTSGPSDANRLHLRLFRSGPDLGGDPQAHADKHVGAIQTTKYCFELQD